MSIVRHVWKHFGVSMGEVRPCRCNDRAIYAAPEKQIHGGYKIVCANCNKSTKTAQSGVRTALSDWNNTAQI